MNEKAQYPPKTMLIVKAVLFCAAFILLYLLIYFLKSLFYSPYNSVIHAGIGIFVAGMTIVAFLKWDKRTFASIGLSFSPGTPGKFLSGLVIGMGLMGLMTISVIYFSGFTIEANKNSGLFPFLGASLPLLPLAFMEELGFRAYPLVTLREKNGDRTAIILTSLLFALYHLANGWTVQDSFLGAGVWGILFGLAAVYSNGIALPTGMHYAVNLTTAAFGVIPDSSAIWILKQKDGSSLENYQSGQWETLIPQLSLLVLGIGCMEWYIRKKNTK